MSYNKMKNFQNILESITEEDEIELEAEKVDEENKATANDCKELNTRKSVHALRNTCNARAHALLNTCNASAHAVQEEDMNTKNFLLELKSDDEKSNTSLIENEPPISFVVTSETESETDSSQYCNCEHSAKEQEKKLENVATNGQEVQQQDVSLKCKNSEQLPAESVFANAAALDEDALLSELGYTNETVEWQSFAQAPQRTAHEMKLIAEALQQPQMLTIIIGSSVFDCQAALLRLHANFFNEPENVTDTIFSFNYITPCAFRTVYAWMQCERPFLQRDNFMEVCIAASLLQVTELSQHCVQCFATNGPFQESAAFMLFTEARTMDIEHTMYLLLKRIGKFFLTLVASKDFLQLSLKHILVLLTSDRIAVNNENEVLLACVRWLNYNWLERRDYVCEVLDCVRFQHVPICNLAAYLTHQLVDCVAHVFHRPSVIKILKRALSYRLRELFGIEQGAAAKQFYVMPQRKWISDRRCLYHTRNQHAENSCVTYKMFNHYLQIIRSGQPFYWRRL